MRILIHDFAGHAFPLHLSRALARRGHEVVHAYSTGLQGPKGQLNHLPSDPPNLRILPVALPGVFRKYSPVRRLIAQHGYARQLCQLVRSERPDVVLSANTPIDIQFLLCRACVASQTRFVHWCQDVYCEALEFLLKPKLGRLAHSVTLPFRMLERSVNRHADSVVVIASEFVDILKALGISTTKLSVIENWASLEDIQPLASDTPWRRAVALDDRPIFLYSGTLGLKHNPQLLYRLAKHLGPRGQVVVVSEGIGRKYLEALPSLDNLILVNFAPYERLAEVLASADVFIATLEPEAGNFAVPSKVLSYLCAGRPVLLAAPASNLSATTLETSGAGIAIAPDKTDLWLEAALSLAEDPGRRALMGKYGRKYAVEHFEIEAITDRFENILGNQGICHEKNLGPLAV